MNLLLISLELSGLCVMEQPLAHFLALATALLLQLCGEQRTDQPSAHVDHYGMYTRKPPSSLCLSGKSF